MGNNLLLDMLHVNGVAIPTGEVDRRKMLEDVRAAYRAATIALGEARQ